jgi:hypothetical protein
MFRIKLANGLDVGVDSLKMLGTYSGVLEGAPGENLNNHLLEDIKEKINEKGYYVRYPSNEEIMNRLPKCRLEAHLTSYYTSEDNYDFSHVTAIWFDDIDKSMSIKDILQNGLKDLDWGKHYSGYDL